MVTRESSAMDGGGTFGYGIRPTARMRACFHGAIPVAPGYQNVEVSVVSFDQTAAATNALIHQGGPELQEFPPCRPALGASRLPPCTGLGVVKPA